MKARFKNTTNAIVLEVWVRGVVDFVGGQSSSESREPIVGVIEIGRDVVAFLTLAT